MERVPDANIANEKELHNAVHDGELRNNAEEKRSTIMVMNDIITRTPDEFSNTKFFIWLFKSKWTQKQSHNSILRSRKNNSQKRIYLSLTCIYKQKIVVVQNCLAFEKS